MLAISIILVAACSEIQHLLTFLFGMLVNTSFANDDGPMFSHNLVVVVVLFSDQFAIKLKDKKRQYAITELFNVLWLLITLCRF